MMQGEGVSRRSAHHNGTRSPSPSRRRTRSQSPRHQARSPSPDRRSARSPSPTRRSARSPSPTRRSARSPSPTRRSARSPSPTRRSTSSPSPTRKRATSPPRGRKGGWAPAPVRNGGVSNGIHTLEHFAKLNFNKAVKRPSIVKGNSNVEVWQHTTEPIQRSLLKHLNGNQQLSGQACTAFKAIMKYMGDFPTKKSNLHGNFVTDKIFQSAMRYEELKDEIFCQIIKQLTGNKLSVSEERGWELMWLATGIFTSSRILQPEITKFLRSARHKLAQDCLRRQHAIAQCPRQRKYPPHWVEKETIQHNFTQIFHFVFFPDDKSNASFQVSSSMTVGELCRSIIGRLGLKSTKGFGLFLIMSQKIVALHDESEFFFDALRRQIDWEEEGIKSTKKSDMPVLAYQMYFLRKIWTDVVPGEDPQADTIFHYNQERPKFLRGYHRCQREDAVKLAALQFRAQHGNDKSELQNLAQTLSEYLPTEMLRTASVEDWKRAIVSMYNQPALTAMSKEGAKIAFLKIVYRWPTFGSSFFEAEKVIRSDNTERVLLAINKRGVLVIEAQSKDILKTYPYNEIQGWAGSDSDDFILTVGNEKTGAMKLHFKTKMGYKMDDLLTSYSRYMKKNRLSSSTSSSL
ncbi:myosin-VIIa-like isoform X2 [Asterias rubens]|uniref:myosin-VIIa-like isoform X2 n=1 Tax=Asterias rubens TaxID=7604 RepID=UPI0014558FDC|nr:myosin-VIIa-like isoform X2 [Asterias rubens]